MGYDIFSLLPNREAAAEHAKKYRSMWIEPDGSYAEKAPDTLYFRLNIWGMPLLREFHEAIGFDEVNECLYDNSGDVIKSYQCRGLSEMIAKMSDDEIIAEMTQEQLARLRKLKPDADPRLFIKDATSESDKKDEILFEEEEDEVNVDNI